MPGMRRHLDPFARLRVTRRCTEESPLVSAPVVTPTPRPRPSPAPRPNLFVEPNFLLPANPSVSDYRPVVNAEGTRVIFERNPTTSPNDIKPYSLDLATRGVQPFINFASTRPDWCWDRSRRSVHKRSHCIQQ